MSPILMIIFQFVLAQFLPSFLQTCRAQVQKRMKLITMLTVDGAIVLAQNTFCIPY